MLEGGRRRRMEKIGSGLMRFSRELRGRERRQAHPPSGVAVVGLSWRNLERKKNEGDGGLGLILVVELGPTT